MKIKRYTGKNGLENENQFLEDHRFAGALLQFVRDLPGEIQWFIKECIEDEDGTYCVVFRSFECPECRDCILSVKVSPTSDSQRPYSFCVQKQVTR